MQLTRSWYFPPLYYLDPAHIADLAKSFYVGLIYRTDLVPNEYRWVDDSPYSLSATVSRDQSLNHYHLWNDLLSDWGGNSQCLCQGNPGGNKTNPNW